MNRYEVTYSNSNADEFSITMLALSIFDVAMLFRYHFVDCELLSLVRDGTYRYSSNDVNIILNGRAI